MTTAPSELAGPATVPETTKQLQMLSDEDVARASIDNLQAAYRALRDHHAAETIALISRRDDVTRRRDEAFLKCNDQLEESQKLLRRAEQILRLDEEAIDRLGNENARLSEIVDFMQHQAATLSAARPAELTDSTTPDYLADEELTTWAEANGIYGDTMKGTCLRLIVDELHDRRAAEVLFVEVDRQFQNIVDCVDCANGGPDGCQTHKALIYSWRCARSALCDLARIHRSYLMSLNAPGGGDPR